MWFALYYTAKQIPNKFEDFIVTFSGYFSILMIYYLAVYSMLLETREDFRENICAYLKYGLTFSWISKDKPTTVFYIEAHSDLWVMWIFFGSLKSTGSLEVQELKKFKSTWFGKT